MVSAELVAALEAATEGSRELDLRVLQAITRKPWYWSPRLHDTITWDKYGPDAVGNPVCSLDAYTTSLDAALGLVGDRHWMMGKWKDRYKASVISTAIPNLQSEEGCGMTPAIALAAAALRARGVA